MHHYSRRVAHAATVRRLRFRPLQSTNPTDYLQVCIFQYNIFMLLTFVIDIHIFSISTCAHLFHSLVVAPWIILCDSSRFHSSFTTSPTPPPSFLACLYLASLSVTLTLVTCLVWDTTVVQCKHKHTNTFTSQRCTAQL